MKEAHDIVLTGRPMRGQSGSAGRRDDPNTVSETFIGPQTPLGQLRSRDAGVGTRYLTLSQGKGPCRSATDGGQGVTDLGFRDVLTWVRALLRREPGQVGKGDHSDQGPLLVDDG